MSKRAKLYQLTIIILLVLTSIWIILFIFYSFVHIIDTFTSILLTIAGILLTIAIFYQIFNAIRLRNDVNNEYKKHKAEIDYFSSLRNELHVLKSDDSNSLLDININLSLKQYLDTFKEENSYEPEAVFNILKCFNHRVQLERYYINKNKTTLPENRLRLFIYEFLLIDIVCYLFRKQPVINVNNNTDRRILVNSNCLRRIIAIFNEIRPALYIESINRIIGFLESYNASNRQCTYNINDANNLIEYRNSIYEPHKEALSIIGKEFKLLPPIS